MSLEYHSRLEAEYKGKPLVQVGVKIPEILRDLLVSAELPISFILRQGLYSLIEEGKLRLKGLNRDQVPSFMESRKHIVPLGDKSLLETETKEIL